MKQIIWGSMFGVWAAMGCAAEVSSTQSNLVICEGEPIDGAACLVGEGGLCATATNAEGNLCECMDVPGSRTGNWECFAAEPSGHNTCRGVVEGAACVGAEDECVRSYAGFDVVCECGVAPGTRPVNTWSCHAVSTCEGPACDCDGLSADVAGCPAPEPSPVDCERADREGAEMAGCPSPGPTPGMPSAEDCDRADREGAEMAGCPAPGPAPSPADCDSDSADLAACEPACAEGEDCSSDDDDDDCPGFADCGPTCDAREAARRRCERDYEVCLAGPPSLISCEDQRMYCMAALPSCSSMR